jgi:hypothetical protein
VLYRQPDAVRAKFQELPESPSSRFFAAYVEGDRDKNPDGMGGFPFSRASAAAGKEIADFRARSIADIIIAALEGNSQV